ncbi:hypothetical protein BCR34DRAFT_194320 [Clohesyomyces aquaticus]|uniref:RNase III domain-containing protein n=1 Tax=Clohesyomyces aquaticus TaxID=1231657 RepID=A0A1Y1YC23_9PLEO|nr:hypothetical protein BCR34DRAFT_194320 [Clohesyomyces aquaticus]
MVSNVQAIIGYQFSNIEKLKSALQAAHRDRDIEGPSDDGNRALSLLGLHVIDTIQTSHVVEEQKCTKKDVNTRDPWFKDKKRRAAACKMSGIDQYIIQSPRQQHEEPSVAVRANALSALVGAVWLDMQRSHDISLSDAVEKISKILDRMQTVIGENTENRISADKLRPIGDQQSPKNISGETLNIAGPTRFPDQTCDIPEIRSIDQIEMVLTDDSEFPPLDNQLSQGNNILLSQEWLPLDPEPPATEIASRIIGPFESNSAVDHQEQSTQILRKETGCFEHSFSIGGSSSTALVPAKRPLPKDDKKRPHRPALWERLVQKELEKVNGLQSYALKDLEALLRCSEIEELSRDDSQVMELRFLYFAIGSCQSLIGFANTLRAARKVPAYFHYFSREGMCSTERYQKIHMLSDQEALCILLRRYHTIQLFQTEQTLLNCSQGIIMEDPSTTSVRQKSPAGNPRERAKAQLTDKIRGEVKRLRRLATMLQVWTDTYGFGILALLPSGPAWSEFTLTDSFCLLERRGIGIFLTWYTNVKDRFSKRLARLLSQRL